MPLSCLLFKIKSNFGVLFKCPLTPPLLFSLSLYLFLFLFFLSLSYCLSRQFFCNILGKAKVGVIVHDMSMENILDDRKYEEKMESFRRQQPTTFNNAAMVFISGQLADSPAQLGPGNWTELRTFIAKASRLSEAPPHKALRKVLLPAFLIFAIIVALIVSLSVGLT